MENLKQKYTIEQLQGMMADLLVSQRETSNQMKETDKKIAETDSLIEKNNRFLTARFKELSKQIGGIGKSNGDFAEEFFYNSFDATMQVGEIKYDYIEQNKNKKINNQQGEYDIVLTNGSAILLVEVKYKLKMEQVIDYYENKIPKFRKLFPEFENYTIHAAMAAMSFEKNTKKEVVKKGMLLFTQFGDNLKKISPEDMKPKEF